MRGAMRSVRGVTLIELMVVIAIIGILAGLLIPAVQLMRNKARVTQTQAEAKAFSTAIVNYHHEYGRWPVPGEEEQYSGGTFTENRDIVSALHDNPRDRIFWEDTNTVFRDPWGDPYRVTIDARNSRVTVTSSHVQ